MTKNSKKKSKFWQPSFYYKLNLLFLGFVFLLNYFGILESELLQYLVVILVFITCFLSIELGLIALFFTQSLDLIQFVELRLYQWLIVGLIIALLVRFIQTKIIQSGKKQKQANLFKALLVRLFILYKSSPTFFWLLVFLLIGSLIGLSGSPVLAFSVKQTLVLGLVLLASYLVYYWVRVKRFGADDLLEAFIWSSVPVGLYSIFQNIAHEFNFKSLEVMPARPNAGFYEPDWLGIYTALVLVICLFKLTQMQLKQADNETIKPTWLLNRLNLFLISFLNFIVLIISVARASWVGLIAAVLGIWFFVSLGWALKKISISKLRRLGQAMGLFLLSFAVAFATVVVLKLSRFNLTDRALSIYTQEHIITKARKGDHVVKIDLEEIEHYQRRGYEIFETKIQDENIEARQQAFSTNWELTKKHWLAGQGQGSTLSQRGYLHNANNIFYEWLIAAGITGLAAFLLLLALPILSLLRVFFRRGQINSSIILNYILFIGALSVVIITNLFNSGIFFLPIWLTVGLIWGIKVNLDRSDSTQSI
ncbi:MAG: hypothetical protein GF332_00325 [Candidatus Moranbacteria bacterium]|nr:hypothetical protein [Candidatus Moranbacteria bacterium]